MIHNLSALPAGMPAIQAQGAKAAKGGVEAAILALFSKALATQLQAGEAATPPAAAKASVSALSVPLLPDAPSLVAVAAPPQKSEGAVEQVNPAATLAAEVLVDPSQLPGLASIAVAAVPSQAVGLAPQKLPEPVVAAASLLAVVKPGLATKPSQATAEPVVAAASLLAVVKPGLATKPSQATAEPVVAAASLLTAKPSQTAPEPVLTAEVAEGSPDLESVPAVGKNPLVLAGMKNLPVTPAGIAANAHAFQNASAQELPAGIQMKVGLGEILDPKVLVPSLEDGASLPLVPGAQNLADGAKLVSTSTPFSALPVQTQGESLGLSLGASRQVAQLVTPFTQPQWQSELADKVVWLAGRQSHMAALSLNPPSLGNIEVRLNLSGNDAGAQFFSANPTVREAIEAALPRLREMMAEAGLSLGQAMVSSEPFRDREAAAQQRAEGGGAEDESEGVLTLASGLGHGRPRSGLVDLYV